MMAVIIMGIGLMAGCVDDTGILVDRHGAVAMRIAVMLDRVAARVARMRADDGDQAGKDRADQGQKDDGLDHLTR